MDGFDPHDGNNFPVKVKLPPGVAKHVFQLTAMNECRYNFCLNSIKESWPELSFLDHMLILVAAMTHWKMSTCFKSPGD